jgi:DNA polymerase
VSEEPIRGAREAVRGCVVAAPRRRLGVVDWANIEGRLGAWNGGEEWKLQAFREQDEGTGPDVYRLAYARAFGVSVEEARREVGKVMELALQYQGGVGAFATFAAAYRLDLEALALTVDLPEWAYEEAVWLFEHRKEFRMPLFGLSRDAWIMCDAVKRLWRRANAGIGASWPALEDAWTLAFRRPGTPVSACGVTVERVRSWMRVRLPSGRYLCYPGAKVDIHPDTGKASFSYLGDNHYTRQWGRIGTYGGKMFENIVQGEAGDILADALVELERANIAVIGHTHDEPFAEIWNDRDLDAMLEVCERPVWWAPTMPLAAKGFVTDRYRKD